MSGNKKTKYKMEWDKAHTKMIHMKLNLKTDEDILKRFDEVGNVQGYLKELVRKDIKKSK